MPQILEARVTNPERDEVLKYPQGLAVVTFNSLYEVLLGNENHADVYRALPARNIQTETWDPISDRRIKGPLARAVREELGMTMDRFRVIPGTYRETNGLYVQTIGYPYKYRCICLQYLGDPTEPAHTVFHAKDGEISDHKWFPLDSLPDTLEPGARLLIDAYREILKI